MSDELIALPRAAVESLRKHLQQECEASGTVEGGCIASDALNRMEDLLAAAKPAIDAGVWGVLKDPEYPDDRSLARSDKSLAMPVGTRRLFIAADAAEEG